MGNTPSNKKAVAFAYPPVAKRSTNEELRRVLLRLLECPVCLDPMQRPIEQCVNGHNVCNVCRKRLASCPTCRGKLKGVRNRLVEEFADILLLLPCTYDGCLEMLYPSEVLQHKFTCYHRPYPCKICHFPVAFSNLYQHCKDAHPMKLFQLPLAADCKIFTNASNDMYSCDLVATSGNLFWFWRHRTDNCLYLGVQHCGEPRVDLRYFKYRMTISDKCNIKELSFTRPVHKDGVSHSSIEEHCECFNVSANFLKNMLVGNGHIYLNLSIYQ